MSDSNIISQNTELSFDIISENENTIVKNNDILVFNEPITSFFPKNNAYAPNNPFTKIIYDSIDNAMKSNNTNFTKLYNILNESIDYNGKSPKLIFKAVKEQIYNMLLNSPGRNKLQQLFSDNLNKLSLDSINPIIENWIKYNRNTSITSPFYNNKNTIFETKDFFIQVLNKGDGFWSYDDSGVMFLAKDKNMTLEKYNKLNDEGKSHYALINNQFVTSTPIRYFIQTITDEAKNNGKYLFNTGIDKYSDGKLNISDNELYQFTKLLVKLEKQNYDFKQKKYFGIDDSPYVEYLVNKNDSKFLNSNTILYNGIGRDYNTNKKVYAEDLLKDGFKILDPFELRQEVNGSQNLLAGKWKEISEYKYNLALKSTSHFKHQNDGFFSSYPHYGDLRYFYQKYNGKYYTSLQRLSYERDYILENLKSAVSRIEPLNNKYEYLKNYLKDYNQSYYESFVNKGKIPNLNYISYEMLKAAGFTVTKISRSGFDGIDGKEFENNKYSYDIRNQISEKTSKNKYDQFACKYLDEYSRGETANLNLMKRLLDKFSFRGDTLSLAKNLIENKNDKYKNYETLENILHNGFCQFQVSPPALSSISSFVSANGIAIDSFIKSNAKKEVNLDNINTDISESKIKRSMI